MRWQYAPADSGEPTVNYCRKYCGFGEGETRCAAKNRAELIGAEFDPAACYLSSRPRPLPMNQLCWDVFGLVRWVRNSMSGTPEAIDQVAAIAMLKEFGSCEGMLLKDQLERLQVCEHTRLMCLSDDVEIASRQKAEQDELNRQKAAEAEG